MTSFAQKNIRGIAGAGTLAGLTGGLAEIVWIWIYGVISHIDSASVAHGVSRAVGIETLADPVVLGIAVHMTLAAALAMVWAVNFFVVLPVLSPGFVGLVPYEVSLLSKILFGVSAAAVLAIRADAMPYARRTTV